MAAEESLESIIDRIVAYLNAHDLTVYDFPRVHIRVLSKGTGVPSEMCTIAISTLRARIEGLDPRRIRRQTKAVHRKVFAQKARADAPQFVAPNPKNKRQGGQRRVAPKQQAAVLQPVQTVINVTDDLPRYTAAIHAALLQYAAVSSGAWRSAPARDHRVFVTEVIGTVQAGQAVMLLAKLEKQGVFVDCANKACGRWHVTEPAAENNPR